MIEKTERPQHLFIVRMWLELCQATPPGQWRGSVEHVPSGQRIYFATLGDLTGFIDRQIVLPVTVREMHEVHEVHEENYKEP
jgi:hypothetical protein